MSASPDIFRRTRRYRCCRRGSSVSPILSVSPCLPRRRRWWKRPPSEGRRPAGRSDAGELRHLGREVAAGGLLDALAQRQRTNAVTSTGEPSSLAEASTTCFTRFSVSTT
jgi:hypothetical protein